MKIHLTKLVFAFSFIAAVAFADDPFPHQPNINIALKELADAQKAIAGSGGKPGDALMHLRQAHTVLEKSSNNKGSFRATAIRLTGQAVNHLEKGETDKAVHEIAEAVEAVNKAGVAGSK